MLVGPAVLGERVDEELARVAFLRARVVSPQIW
jgi:hypothetical protein